MSNPFSGVTDKGIERAMIEGRENKIFEIAYVKARTYISEDAIEASAFEGIYDSGTLAKDAEEIKRKRIEHDKSGEVDERDPKRKAVSRILEALIADRLEGSEWLGSGAETRIASEYDDYKNGVDVIAYLGKEKGDKGCVPLAIDVTSDYDPEKKLKRIRDEIDHGGLRTLKYFEYPEGEDKGERSNVPCVMIAIDRATIMKLAELWGQMDLPGASAQAKEEARKALLEHPVQIQILEEIILQLQTFRTYAERKGKMNVVAYLDKALDLIGATFDDPKKGALARHPNTEAFIKEDGIYKKLKNRLKETFEPHKEKEAPSKEFRAVA